MARIRKMESRGWKRINEPCDNPRCVLANEEDYQKYEKECQDRYIEQERHDKELLRSFDTYLDTLGSLTQLDGSQAGLNIGLDNNTRDESDDPSENIQ